MIRKLLKLGSLFTCGCSFREDERIRKTVTIPSTPISLLDRKDNPGDYAIKVQYSSTKSFYFSLAMWRVCAFKQCGANL